MLYLPSRWVRNIVTTDDEYLCQYENKPRLTIVDLLKRRIYPKYVLEDVSKRDSYCFQIVDCKKASNWYFSNHQNDCIRKKVENDHELVF